MSRLSPIIVNSAVHPSPDPHAFRESGHPETAGPYVNRHLNIVSSPPTPVDCFECLVSNLLSLHLPPAYSPLRQYGVGHELLRAEGKT